MENHGKFIVLAIALLLACANPCFAAQSGSDLDKQLKLADDITKETIVGPGSVQVTTGKDILMSFGATARIIPTSESDWDFGVSDSNPVKAGGLVYGGLAGEYFKTHSNESGSVQDSYIRTEAKMYFNAMPKDRAWSFYAALEFDRPIETSSVDSRGGKTNNSSNFGLERLHLTYALPMNMRLHAGWDIWHLDAFEGAGMVYGDDNPGFWLTGENEAFSYNVGYFKLMENDFQDSATAMKDGADDDRDLYAGYVTWQPNDKNKIQFLAALDRIRDVVANDMYAAGGSPFGISGGTPDTDSYHGGAYWVGKFGGLEIFTEAVYQFGSADNTGLSSTVGPDRVTALEEDYDINAYALAADVSYEFKGMLTDYPLKPHLGFMYTSGDDDPYDDKLEGYNGVENAQRFSARWGGENTIIGDTNLLLGTALYGYLPEFYGNGTPVMTGGLQNFAGNGNGRGDNPGLTLISAGITVAPKRFLIFKTNINSFWWNEDIYVTNIVDPVDATINGPKKVDAGYVGTEWDNELTFATSKHSFIKGQAAFFFPGEVIEDVTKALTGESSDEMAMRLAAELIINF